MPVPLTVEEFVRPFLQYLTIIIEIAAGIVIAISIIRDLLCF
jgi:hypothetical protein